MKKLFLSIAICFNFIVYSQENKGYVIEYNKLTSIEFQVYNPPLRINKVELQTQIDYTSISGLLQSYLSANNIDWAKSEYIDAEEKITRDEAHFEAVKKSDVNDYIQLETAYIFDYQDRRFAFIKYSSVFEKLPFPWTGLMIFENKNNRWYISKLINQNQILFFLGNSNDDFIIDCLAQKANDIDVKKIIEKSRTNYKISISKLSQQLDLFDERLKMKFYDKRITNDKIDFRNALQNSSIKTYKFDIYHPFLINSLELNEYKNSNKIIKDENSSILYKDKPEFILLNDQPIDFISKIFIDYGDRKYFLVKYKMNNKKIVSVIENDRSNNFKIIEESSFDGLSNVLLEYDLSIFRDLIESPKQVYVGNSGGVNIDEMLSYIEKNKTILAKYLDE